MKRVSLVGVFVAIVLVIFVSPFSSKFPDGLERVAEDKGFSHKCKGEELFKSPFPDYVVPGIRHEGIATVVSGLVGVVICFGVGVGLGYILRKREK
jgi:cobalt/nickel transport protein